MQWHIVYKSATKNRKSIWDTDVTDADLVFPKKLTIEFLRNAHKTMGSYIYANQYENVIIPESDRTFKKEWFKYYDKIPEKKYTYIYFDPAISEAVTADYTGVVVVHCDESNRRYVEYAQRHKINPTQIIDLIFSLYDKYRPISIGIEDVAYQKALLHFAEAEMRRRNKIIPIQGVRPATDRTKEMRILSLVPYFEWSNMYLNRGLSDLEMELLTFPRAAHDDLIDALASVQEIIFPPPSERKQDNEPAPNHPDYEKWKIRQYKNRKPEPQDDGYNPYSGYD